MDISARASSLGERHRSGQMGHQCSRAPGRPNLHLISSSRRPRRATELRASSCSLKLVRFEGTATGQNSPCDARYFVSERDCKDVAVQSLFGSLDPGSEPMAFPAHWLDEHDPRCLHE